MIVIDASKGALLVDLGSSYGTAVGSNRIPDNIGSYLKTGSEIVFGASSRVYKVHVDYRQMQKSLHQRQKMLQMEVNEISNFRDDNLDDLRKKVGSKYNNTIVVLNLPYHYVEDDVARLFQECGAVVSCHMFRQGAAEVQLDG